MTSPSCVKLFFLLLGLLFVLAHPHPAAAQKTKTSGSMCLIDGSSGSCLAEATYDMVVNDNGTEIETDSNIENMGSEYIGAVAIEGDLYDDTTGALLDPVTDTDSGNLSADVPVSTSVHTPDEYELDTIPSACIYDGEGCEWETGPTYPMYIETDYPQVTSINPTSVTVGTSGIIKVAGQNFIDTFGNSPTPFINNSGAHLSLSGTPTNTQAQVSYTVDQGAATGDFGLNLKGIFGNGEPATLTVGDPSPNVLSISPNVWYAGNSYPMVTISGTNFGTNPTSSLSPAPGVTYTQTAGGDASITASVKVAADAPTTNPITVTVTSTGFGGGNGFAPGTPGGSATSSKTAQAVAGTPPAPPSTSSTAPPTPPSPDNRGGSGKLNTGEGGGSRLMWPKMA
jgi:hypothetical protein